MLLSIQPFLTKASAKKPASPYFDVKTDLSELPRAASAAMREKPWHDESRVSGLDHYIDSRFSGELFRID
ncbi:hypothetical protein ISN76_20865 [Dyella halodurans]|uniref:Uncharacterized protein n=1 Tax=Dyella halodurans TaxID=1920171 RepID=A0ABV9BYB5_9GAMM|nr:hypothetical protein [Dyella halodurans]